MKLNSIQKEDSPKHITMWGKHEWDRGNLGKHFGYQRKRGKNQ